MTNEEFQKVIDRNYELLCSYAGLEVFACRDENDPTASTHCVWMLNSARRFFKEGATDKANRWLGYVQGVLAHKYRVPLDDLKKANTV